MNQCLKTKNLLTILCEFLPIKSIILFSHLNKTINEALNPKKNFTINLIYFQYILKTYFEYDDDYNFCKKKNLLSKYLHFHISWKSFMREIVDNLRIYTNKKISQKVLDCLKIHMYLPDLRKENSNLEFESSTINQTFYYDMIFRATCNSNFYGKYITLEYMTKKITEEKKEDKNNKIEDKKENLEKEKCKECKEDKECINKEEKEGVKILREGLFFEDELKDFRNTYEIFINNNKFREIIDNVIKYNYEFLYNEYNNNYYYYNNEIIKLLLWINNLFILYSNFNYEYINSFSQEINEKTILNEFVHKHNEIISCALLFNYNFGNINIIMNQIIRFNDIFKDINKYDIFLSSHSLCDSNSTTDSSSSPSENIENKFIENYSLYKLFIQIIKKFFYDKLFLSEKNEGQNKINLLDKFKILIDNFFKDLFENFNEKYKNKNKNDDVCDYDNMIIEDENEMDMSIDEDMIEKEPTEKETIENIMNVTLDYVINEKTANGINHTELKIPKIYENMEDILKNGFNNALIESMKKNKPNTYYFEIIETMTKSNCNEHCLIRHSDSLILINKTKKKLMETTFHTLIKKVLKDLQKCFIAHIKIEKNEKRIVLNNNEIQNCVEYKCDLSDLSSKQKMKVTEAVEEEIKNLKTFLLDKNIKLFEEKIETEKLINDFIEEDRIEDVLLVKKMIWFYHRELQIYKYKNEKIEKILNKGLLYKSFLIFKNSHLKDTKINFQESI